MAELHMTSLTAIFDVEQEQGVRVYALHTTSANDSLSCVHIESKMAANARGLMHTRTRCCSTKTYNCEFKNYKFPHKDGQL